VAALALVAAYPLSAWLIGVVVERQLQAREEQNLRQVAPYLSLIQRTYRRNVYGATEVVTYGLGEPFARVFRSIPGGGASLSSFRLTIRNTIHHGPLPRLRAFALATMDTELVLPPEAQKRLDALLGRKSALSSHTSISWLGRYRSEIAVPAFQGELAPGITLSSGGVAGTSIATGDLSSVSGDFTAKGFTLRGEGGEAELDDLRGKVAMRRVFSTLNIGDIDLSIGRLDAHVQSKSGPPSQLSLQQLSFVGKTSVTGDYVDSSGELSAGSMRVEKVAATHLAYAYAGRHLYGPALASFTDGLRTAAADNVPGDPQAAQQYQQKILDVVRKDGIDLVVHEPVIEISRVGFAMPEGELRVSAKFAAPGLKRADFDGTTQAMTAAVAQHLQATADIRIDTGLLDRLMEGNPNSDRIAAQTRALEAQGYITQDGNALSAHIVFDRGKLTVNGKAFPPTPDAAPAPHRAPR
jgi:uncharacterized protein YdgA (DUF945 family)